MRPARAFPARSFLAPRASPDDSETGPVQKHGLQSASACQIFASSQQNLTLAGHNAALQQQ